MWSIGECAFYGENDTIFKEGTLLLITREREHQGACENRRDDLRIFSSS